MTDLQPLPLKYSKKVVSTKITGSQHDGIFRVLDDDNKSTYMYQRVDKYNPKCTQLLPNDPVVNNPNQKLARADQMTNTGATSGESPRSGC